MTLETLRKFDILQDLSDAELEVVLRHTSEVSCARGDFLFREGDPGDALYLLREGLIVIERKIESLTAGPAPRETKDLAILPPFSLLGEMALADREPRSASARAEIPVKAYRLSRENFDRLMAESPAIATKLFRALFTATSQRLRATNDELVALYEVGRFVAEARDPRDVAEAILRRLGARVDASYALVALYDPEKNTLRIAHAVGTAGPDLSGLAIPLDSGLPARAFDERKPLLVERMLGATDPWESESMILAPLVERDRAIGLLILGAPKGGRLYRVADLLLASAVSNISAPLLREGLKLG